MAVLGVAYELGRDRVFATQRAAQLTDDALDARIQVHMLAHERGAPAVGAVVSVGLQRTDTTTQQEALELLDVALDGLGILIHGVGVRRHRPGSCRLLRPARG